MNYPALRYAPHCIRLLLCMAALYVAVVTAWVGDDIQITFRQVWNFVHGDGLTFNYGERVQAFTHPAWFFILSGAVAVTRELFLTTLVISIALSVASVALLFAVERRACGGAPPLLTPALLLLFSKAFCDYMTSGLENPLSYFLVGLLLWLLAGNNGTRAARHSRESETLVLDSRLRGNDGGRRWMFLLLALLVLNRPDYGVLLLPLALLLTFTRPNHSPLEGESERQGRSPQPSRWGGKALLHDICPGALLLTAWLSFALIYFGSPLPNTFYAKMGADTATADTLQRAMSYYLATLHRDPVTYVIIAAGIVMALFSRRPALLALAAGQVLYLGFIILAGGDFMLGRFFALPVFLAVGMMVLALNHSPDLRQAASAEGATAWRAIKASIKTPLIAALLSLAATLGAFTTYPFMSTPAYHNPVDTLWVMDERGFYYRGLGMLSPRRNWPQVVTQPDTRPRLANRLCGFLGINALTHPHIHLIDECGLSEPLIARLPAIRPNEECSGGSPVLREYHTNTSSSGHNFRRLPTDYFAYAIGMTDTIADESLRGLLRDLTLATRAEPLLTRQRLGAIWRLNSGHYRRLDLSRYRCKDPLPKVSGHIRFRLLLSDLDQAPKADGDEWQGTLFNWHNPAILPRFFNAAHITAGPPRPAAALQLSLSDTEDYEILVNGSRVAAITSVAEGDARVGILLNHTVPLPRRMLVETIEIRTLGRHPQRAFSIGHLHIKEASE